MEHGTVTNVEYKDGVPVCSVQLQGRVNNEDERVPVMRQHHGMFLVPNVGQQVQMLKLDDQRFIVGVLETGDGDWSPDLSEGELAFMFDDGTRIEFSKTDSGDFDVHVEASGKVYIQGIPFEDHVHDYGDSTIADTGDGSGTESTETKQTAPPQ